MMTWIAIWGVVAITSAVLAGVLARVKRRDHSFWAAWSFIFPPTLLLLVVMRKNNGERPRHPRLDDEAEA